MPAREEGRMMAVLAGGSGLEALGGLAALVLSILGLVGIAPALMLGIAAIVIGASLLANGLAVATDYARLGGIGETRVSVGEIGGGVTLQVLSGIAAIVLGVLALLDVIPGALLPIAAIVIGAGQTLSAGLPERMADLHSLAERTTAPTGATGPQMLIGLGVIVLGILALVGIAPAVLTLVAFLAASVSLLLSGVAVTGAMARLLGR